MRTRTEDVLALADAEPLDAAQRERLLSDPKVRAEVERLARVRAHLRALPELEPPEGTWARVSRAVDASGPRRLARRRMRRLSIAAGVAVAGLVLATLVPELRSYDIRPAVATDLPELARAPDGRARPAAYAPLIAQSAELEALLARLAPQPRLVNAATLGTIVQLEDRIALVDEQLNHVAALDPEERQLQALWRERVELMNALVQVRYAQAQRTAF